ncbi:hypothetical protein [Psychrobacter sp.]|uniref:hypothetical protein n=1 Tax=Psychrobacter sp. TaxID=56811 RepID=UPI00356174C1
MSTIIIWVIGAGLLLINIALRTQILQLKAHLEALRNPKEQINYLRQQATLSQNNKMASIKALRKQYPEISLIEANHLWQQIQS